MPTSKKSNKVISVVVFAIIFIIAIFVLSRMWKVSVEKYSRELYEQDAKNLRDTITELRASIYKYELHIMELEKDRKDIKKEIQYILKKDEEINHYLDIGGIDANVEFLTDRLNREELPKEDSSGK